MICFRQQLPCGQSETEFADNLIRPFLDTLMLKRKMFSCCIFNCPKGMNSTFFLCSNIWSSQQRTLFRKGEEAYCPKSVLDKGVTTSFCWGKWPCYPLPPFSRGWMTTPRKMLETKPTGNQAFLLTNFSTWSAPEEPHKNMTPEGIYKQTNKDTY